jgi:hypothetical protein
MENPIINKCFTERFIINGEVRLVSHINSKIKRITHNQECFKKLMSDFQLNLLILVDDRRMH